jgi:hypothetical protein
MPKKIDQKVIDEIAKNFSLEEILKAVELKQAKNRLASKKAKSEKIKINKKPNKPAVRGLKKYLDDVTGDEYMKQQEEVSSLLKERFGKGVYNKLERVEDMPTKIALFGKSISKVFNFKTKNLIQFFNRVEPELIVFLKHISKKLKGAKFFTVLYVKLSKVHTDGDGKHFKEEVSFPIRSQSKVVTNPTEVARKLMDCRVSQIQAIEQLKLNSTGWTFEHTIGVEIHILKYKPLKGKSYIPLPSWISAKKCCININNKDNKCFLWSVLAHLHPTDVHAERVTNYKKFEDELIIDDIEMPMKLDDIYRFEKLNCITINVYGIENNEVYILHKSEERNETVVNLLFVEDDKNNHYVYIKDLDKLLNCRARHQMFHCPHCLHGFVTEELLLNHYTFGCDLYGNQKTEVVDDENNVMRFGNVENLLKHPFIIYADFEACTQKIEKTVNDITKSYTCKEQEHVASGYCLYLVSTEPKYNKMLTYTGEKCMENFFRDIQALGEIASQAMDTENQKPMKLTIEQEKLFRNQKNCNVCEKPLKQDRVRDHDHITGTFRGACHNNCNLLLTMPDYTPVVFHNLTGYDSHLILKNIGQYMKEDDKLKCIPNNMEKYKSFTWNKLRFIDSFQFMASSLDKLGQGLKDDDKKHIKKFYKGEKFSMMNRKGVFPYDYYDSLEKLKDNKLPSKESFYSALSGEHIKDSEYEHALKVWKEFNCKTFKDYHDLYMKVDVLLLADVFETFREKFINMYRLDPAHYFSLPAYSFDCALLYTKVELELFTDINMYLFCERAIRGGISVIGKRYAKANNKYLDNYDSKVESSYLMYLDANNLYGWAMCQKLPIGDFEWIDVNGFDINCNVEEDHGYFVEVDIEYPKELHELHNTYPLAPERKTVKENELSQFSKDLLTELDMNLGKESKLIPNLHDKKNYICDLRNLQFYMKHGLKVTKIHKVLGFYQKAWLKRFIKNNTKERKKAKTAFEKDLYKLLNNAVFGKTMENVRGHVDIQLVSNERTLEKQVCKPSFQRQVQISKNLVSVHLAKNKVKLNKPIYCGVAILDLSKVLMYKFHYEHMLPKYGKDNIDVCMTDTDSLFYHVKTDDIYKDMNEHKDLYDFGGYSKDHFCYDSTNDKVVGKFKDETNGVPISEYVGLRSKMYAFVAGGKQSMKAKGVSKTAIKTSNFDEYKSCLFDHDIKMKTFRTIRSQNQELYTLELNKVGLSPFDDKRYILEDGINTLAYGHKDI